MKDLQLQIAELTAKHELETFAQNMFPSLKVLSILSNNKKRFVITAENSEHFNEIISKLPPTNPTTTIGYASKEPTLLNTPFRIDLDNPCKTSEYSKFKLKIDYISNDIHVDIELPIELIKEWVYATNRNITDCEYHYFTGSSMVELRKIKVRCYAFNTPSQISWFGGNKTLTEESVINEIISHLTNSPL